MRSRRGDSRGMAFLFRSVLVGGLGLATVIGCGESGSSMGSGGADARTLYITARQAVYRVLLANPGLY